MKDAVCARCEGHGVVRGVLYGFVSCKLCKGNGFVPTPGDWEHRYAETVAARIDHKEAEKQSKTKEFEGMFDTFREVVDRIDGTAGGWETVTTTLVTPDGKRWKMSKIRVVFTDDNEEDELECELVEVPNRT